MEGAAEVVWMEWVRGKLEKLELLVIVFGEGVEMFNVTCVNQRPRPRSWVDGRIVARLFPLTDSREFETIGACQANWKPIWKSRVRIKLALLN